MLLSRKVTCARTDAMDADSLFLDYYEGCSVEDLDEFNTPSPSEDIWKKFELLPTPPRSPSREMGSDDLGPFSDHLSFVSELLDDDLEMHINSQFFESPLPSVKNELLHDCMWSGQCAENCKQKAAREKYQAPDTLTPTPLASAAAVAAPVPTTPTVEVAEPAAVLPNLDEVSESQCVDPSSILSYTPLSDHSYHQANNHRNETEKPSGIITLVRSRGGVWKREYVVSDTPSESEDEEEEEEEIDVVTVVNDKQQQQHQQQQQRVAPTMKTSSGRIVTPPQKQLLSATLNSVKSRLVCKRSRQDVTDSVKRVSCHRFSSSRSGSDSEDSEKRREHNSMERKRRDDLRYAFQYLREMVPDLKDNPKAPKVLILCKAAQYVKQLTNQGHHIERTLKLETQRQKTLQRKLHQLQRHAKTSKHA